MLLVLLSLVCFALSQEGECDLTCEQHALSLLSETIVPGFHILCLSTANDALHYTIWKDGQSTKIQFSSPATWESLTSSLEQQLSLNELGTHPPAKYPWTIFTSQGIQITSLEAIPTEKAAFIFKGGNFIWPGVRVGHTQVVEDVAELGSVTLTTISMQPLIFSLENFFTDNECEHIIQHSEPKMFISPVSHHDAHIGKPSAEWRTSTQAWLAPDDETLKTIDRKAATVIKIPSQNSEHLQVLRYQLGQFYDAHLDFFNPNLYQSTPDLLKRLDGGRNNRLVTVFLYLSDVEEGGETVFPRFGNYKGEVNLKSCERGLKIQPKRGKVAIFYSMHPDGQYDENSLHGACPVISGLKWAANKWFWTSKQHF